MTYLTPADLATLTGRPTAAAQVRWLKDRGWPFELSADRKPIVLRAYHDARLSGAAPETPPATHEPARGVFRRMAHGRTQKAA